MTRDIFELYSSNQVWGIIFFAYLKGGKTKVPFVMTMRSPWMLCVINWSSWYHSILGGGIPVATHSTRAPVELENTSERGGSILQIGAPPVAPVEMKIFLTNKSFNHYNLWIILIKVPEYQNIKVHTLNVFRISRSNTGHMLSSVKSTDRLRRFQMILRYSNE